MATNTKHIDSKKYGKALTLKDRISIADIIIINITFNELLICTNTLLIPFKILNTSSYFYYSTYLILPFFVCFGKFWIADYL